MNNIVVGFDGSPSALAALRWALDEARLRGSHVLVLQAWSVPVLAYASPYAAAPVLELVEANRRAAEDTVANALEEADCHDLVVEHAVVEGGAAEALLDAAADADLLVVGSRGHGGFAGLLLGSVSQQCAHHAPCPVVIVRSPAA